MITITGRHFEFLASGKWVRMMEADDSESMIVWLKAAEMMALDIGCNKIRLITTFSNGLWIVESVWNRRRGWVDAQEYSGAKAAATAYRLRNGRK